MMTHWLCWACIAVPILLAFIWMVPMRNRPPLDALWLAAVPGLVLAIFGGHAGHPFTLDPAATLLLGAASVLWILAGLYARTACRAECEGSIFGPCWLLSMAGSFGVFLTTDRIGFLVCYALVSLPAYGLVIAARSSEAKRAGGLYLAFALVGENILLIGFVLLALENAAALPFLIGGFGLKLALWPFHFWMPAAHAAASVPASAVLSGIVVKAGIIGLIRFVPFDQALPAVGEILAGFGFFTALFAVVVGLRQASLKMILGYSSVSQMGFLAAVIGMGLAGGDPAVIPLAAFYAANHVLVKGGLFLSVGSRAAGPFAWIPAAVLGLGLAGLPLTGGSLAKLAVKDPFGGGVSMVLANVAAAATAMLMLHFAGRLRAAGRSENGAVHRGLPVFLATAIVAFVYPWLLLPKAGLEVSVIIADGMKMLGPVVTGGALFFVFRRWIGRGAESPGFLGRTAAAAVFRTATVVSDSVGWLDDYLRKWPTATAAMVFLVIVLTVLLAFG